MSFSPLADYRLTTAWKLSGTKNFRLASSKLLGYYGTNVQNPSESLMRCIIPPKGHKFIQGDQDGAEARVVAYECRRARLRKLFELNIKPHSYTALQLFTDEFRGEHEATRYKNVEPELLITYPEYKELFKRIKKDQRRYDHGKRVRHAKNYKMGPRTFQQNTLMMTEGEVVLTYAQAKEFLQIDDEVFPELIEWQESIKANLLASRTLRNLFGYPRLFTGIWSESLVRDGCAFVPQSTVGTITNIAFVETHNYITTHHLPWHLFNNKHDSLLISTPDTTEHVEHGSNVLKEHLGKTLTSSRGESYVMGVGISTGYNWGKFHEKNNPNGMREL